MKLWSVSIEPVIEEGVLKAIKMDVEDFEVVGGDEGNEESYDLAKLIEKRMRERE